jgi:hypothetical protein
MTRAIFSILAVLVFLTSAYAGGGSMPQLPPGVTIPGLSGSNQAQNSQTESKWKVPSYKSVCKYLVSVEGWQAEKCSGSNFEGMNGKKLVSAERDYKNNDKKIELTVVSGMGVAASWAPFATGMTIETDKEIMKIYTYNNYKIGVSYDKIEHSGSVIVPLLSADKLKKEAAFAVLGANYENMDYKEAVDFIKNFDFKALEELFRK